MARRILFVTYLAIYLFRLLNRNGVSHCEPGSIRVLIVDDHAMVRTGLATFLETSDDLDLVGQAVVDLCEQFQPEEAVQAVIRTAWQETAPGHALTLREREVLVLLVAGHNNPQISERLCISPGKTRSHVSSILTKLGVSNRG